MERLHGGKRLILWCCPTFVTNAWFEEMGVLTQLRTRLTVEGVELTIRPWIGTRDALPTQPVAIHFSTCFPTTEHEREMSNFVLRNHIRQGYMSADVLSRDALFDIAARNGHVILYLDRVLQRTSPTKGWRVHNPASSREFAELWTQLIPLFV